jgi:hypothetical protein
MRQLRLTYGFKGPEREEVLRQTMIANHDKVIFDYIQALFSNPFRT